jgi:acyl-coenzyme A thioesterase PaaI-like protein
VPYTEPGPLLDRVGPLMNGTTIAGWCSAFACLRIIVTGAAPPIEGFSSRWPTLLLAKLPSGAVILPFLLTTSITYDFIGVARRGQWIEAQADFKRVGREIAFANCYIRSGVGRSDGRAVCSKWRLRLSSSGRGPSRAQ